MNFKRQNSVKYDILSVPLVFELLVEFKNVRGVKNFLPVKPFANRLFPP